MFCVIAVYISLSALKRILCTNSALLDPRVSAERLIAVLCIMSLCSQPLQERPLYSAGDLH